jgi:hypothetical protein
VRAALTADVRFGVYPAVSWVSRHRWDLRSAMDELGYRPVRDAGDDVGPVDGQPGEVHLATCSPARS